MSTSFATSECTHACQTNTGSLRQTICLAVLNTGTNSMTSIYDPPLIFQFTYLLPDARDQLTGPLLAFVRTSAFNDHLPPRRAAQGGAASCQPGPPPSLPLSVCQSSSLMA